MFHVCDVKAAVEAKIIQVSDFTEEETFAYLKMPWNLSKEEAEEFLGETLDFESEDKELYFWNLQTMLLVSADWTRCGLNLQGRI